VGTFYYPVVAVLLVVALATLYKLALPRKLPWYRGVPGAVLAMVFFLLGSVGLRIYLSQITRTGYTYGALAAPIAFLLFTFFIGLAIVVGAHFNSAIQEMWPAKTTNYPRRRWRKLKEVRAAERAQNQSGPPESGPPETVDDEPLGEPPATEPPATEKTSDEKPATDKPSDESADLRS
jgi:membrane protein